MTRILLKNNFYLNALIYTCFFKNKSSLALRIFKTNKRQDYSDQLQLSQKIPRQINYHVIITHDNGYKPRPLIELQIDSVKRIRKNEF